MKQKAEQKKTKTTRKTQIKDLSPRKGDLIKGGDKVEAGSENVRR